MKNRRFQTSDTRSILKSSPNQGQISCGLARSKLSQLIGFGRNVWPPEALPLSQAILALANLGRPGHCSRAQQTVVFRAYLERQLVP
jgi:hypothetical protein